MKMWRYEPFEKQVCTPYHTLAGWLIGQSVCFSNGTKPKPKPRQKQNEGLRIGDYDRHPIPWSVGRRVV